MGIVARLVQGINMSELKYSTSGLPFIELRHEEEDYGNLIFSRTTQTVNGYKYLCFTHRYVDNVKIKKGKGHDYAKIQVNDSCIFNMKMKRDEAGIRGVPQGAIPRRLVDWIIATFKPFLIDDTIFPFSAIKELEPIIEAMDIDKILETKLKRAYKSKKEKVEPEDVPMETAKVSGKLTDLF
jgi:hypothetical protein